MIPILYDPDDIAGVVPSNYGEGALTDAISCTVREERNGAYELEMVYPQNGQFSKLIQQASVIKAKPNFTDDPQLFRVYKIDKNLDGQLTVYAQHISYDLGGQLILSGTASTAVAACLLLTTASDYFNITTDKTVTADFNVSEPSSIRSWFGGKQGSLLDVYGGEWYYDNYNATLKQSRGQNRGVVIRYGKNLTQLDRSASDEAKVTAIVPFYKAENGSITYASPNQEISTGIPFAVDKKQAIDFTQEVNIESATPIATQLTNLANAYISNHNFHSHNITLDFVQSGELSERVDLCDTVTIYYSDGSANYNVKCIETVWDVLEERYISTTFGDPLTNIADTIMALNKAQEDVPSVSYMEQTINRATELITGNLGGYVILHDTDSDGTPDEILIMDTNDITTATKVWRWNKNGLGYSSTGYAGLYGLAMTADGEIVATFITTGTLNADLIKAGTIEDANHNSSINMTTGEAKLDKLKSKSSLSLIDANETIRGHLAYNNVGGTSFGEYTQNGKLVAVISAANSDGGQLRLYNASGTQTLNGDGQTGALTIYNASAKATADMTTVSNEGYIRLRDSSGNERAALYSSSGSGALTLKNSSGNTIANLFNGPNGGYSHIYNSSGAERIRFFVTSTDGGAIYLFNNSTSNTILLNGQTGNVQCVTLTQTSSRKVKENIKPIADAEKILDLEAVSFDYKEKERGTDKRGFIAEDVAKVLPNLVTAETEETPATLDYIQMIPYLQEIIKKQEARIKALEEKINGRDKND